MPRWSPCRRSSPRACPRGRAPFLSACTISARTRPALRKRTSALAGCTLTSTSRASSVTNSASKRMAVARQIIGIGAAHRAEQKLVAHRPAVDEEILAERIGARQRRQRGKAVDDDALAFGRDLDRIGAKIGAENVAEPRQPPGRAGQRRGKGHRRALLAGQREGDVGPAHGEPAHHLAHGFGLGAVELEELQPRRRGVEQIAHLDARAVAERRRLDGGFRAGIDLDRPGVRLAGVPRRDRQPRHGADRRQRLAAKARACGSRPDRRRQASRWHGARPPAPDRPASCPRRRR